MSSDTIACADALTFARSLPDASVNCIVTSPPYFGLRDYGTDGQIGLERTPAEYVARMAELFRELRRVLRDDGTAWLNLGDSFSAEKQLLGIPWRVAFALQDDGWILRSDIIWAKGNPMPESVKDRPTRAHEYVFLLTKSPRYWYDADAIAEPMTSDGGGDFMRDLTDVQPEHGGKSRTGKWARNNRKQDNVSRRYTGFNDRYVAPNKRNRRSVWNVNPQPFNEAHFATFPPKLIEPMILAGCPAGGVVYDPFMGSGTTALVARRLGRHYIGSELNPEYVAMAERRLAAPYTPDMFCAQEALS